MSDTPQPPSPEQRQHLADFRQSVERTVNLTPELRAMISSRADAVIETVGNDWGLDLDDDAVRYAVFIGAIVATASLSQDMQHVPSLPAATRAQFLTFFALMDRPSGSRAA